MHRTNCARPDTITTFTLKPPVAWVLFAVCVASLIFGLWVRYGLVENPTSTRACLEAASVSCGIRQAAIEIFNRGLFGGVALGAALINLWRPHLLIVATAAPAALLGLILYNTTVSALAMGLILLVFARPEGRRAPSTVIPPG